jgi:hypothetical protein
MSSLRDEEYFLAVRVVLLLGGLVVVVGYWREFIGVEGMSFDAEYDEVDEEEVEELVLGREMDEVRANGDGVGRGVWMEMCCSGEWLLDWNESDGWGCDTSRRGRFAGGGGCSIAMLTCLLAIVGDLIFCFIVGVVEFLRGRSGEAAGFVRMFTYDMRLGGERLGGFERARAPRDSVLRCVRRCPRTGN